MANRDETEEEITLFLFTKGVAGKLPDWYPVMVAARYMGVAPWALARQWYGWVDRALLVASVEHETAKGPQVEHMGQ